MPATLQAAELQAPLERHLLHLLTAKDLVNLSLTSRSLKTWLEAADPAIWQSACRQHLPASYPPPAAGASMRDLLQPMRRRHTAKQNLLAGHPVCIHHLQGNWPAFSPDGSRIAVAHMRLVDEDSFLQPFQLTMLIYDTCYGTILHRSSPTERQSRTPDLQGHVAWTRNGRQLAVLVDAFCWTVTADLQVVLAMIELPLSNATTLFTLSPHGKYVQVITKIEGGPPVHFEMQVVHAQDGQPVFQPPISMASELVTWDPGEQRLAFCRDSEGIIQIVVRGLQSSDVNVILVLARPLQNAFRAYDCLAWTADGLGVVALSCEEVRWWSGDDNKASDVIISWKEPPLFVSLSATNCLLTIHIAESGFDEIGIWTLSGTPHCTFRGPCLDSQILFAGKQAIETWPAYRCAALFVLSGNIELYKHLPGVGPTSGAAVTPFGVIKTHKYTNKCFRMRWNDSGTAMYIQPGARWQKDEMHHDTSIDVTVVLFAA